MTHTVESLLKQARTLAERYCDMRKYHSEETVSDYQTFHNGLQSALTEVLAELEVRKAYADEQTDFAIKNANERDTLQSKVTEQAQEIERLTGCLKKANDNHEEFERRWYLACEERDQLQTCVSEWVAANGPLGWISELRAKVTEMEKQEPIGYVFDDGENIYTGSVIRRNQIDGYVPVYLAPGAAQEKTE